MEHGVRLEAPNPLPFFLRIELTIILKQSSGKSQDDAGQYQPACPGSILADAKNI
jgi:hypothetical protein